MERNYNGYYDSNFEELKGKTLTKIDVEGVDKLTFFCDDNTSYHMVYYPDCCASCSIEDICGNLDDLIGSPILLAEEVSSREPDETTITERKSKYNKEDSYSWGAGPDNGWREESETWTFYKLSTIKGSVTIRWYGSSNGWYSESVTFERIS